MYYSESGINPPSKKMGVGKYLYFPSGVNKHPEFGLSLMLRKKPAWN